MAKFKEQKKEYKITFRLDSFEKLLLDSFFRENNVKNKSAKIRSILFKYIIK